jgi:GT2 family glycosyltransferase/glycosyltransferase involved in cell wall biosynthesis
MKRIFLWILLLPLQVALILVFLSCDLVHALLSRLRAGLRPADPVAGRDCTVVVLNWNGRPLLEECLPALVRAVERSDGDHQILVVDNGSSDDSLPWLRGRFPRVDVLALPENLGFVAGNNRGVEAARNPIVVLLNNDMIVSEGFLDPLLDPFDDPEVFAVSSQIDFPEGRRREETGATRGNFRLGFLHLAHGPIRNHHYTRKRVPVLWAGGGSSAFRRDRFLELGGFSRIFSPCYFEDTDLSYRAWRRGWKVLLAADSRVLHKHRSSTSVRFSEAELARVIEERRLWYLWKNFQFRTLLNHLTLLPLNLTKWVAPSAYFRALRRLPRILAARLREPRRRHTDRRILGWATHPLPLIRGTGPLPETSSRLRILVVSAYLPHLGTHGGAGRVFQLMKRVAERHDVTLLAFVEDDRDESFADQARAVCRRLETVRRRNFEPLSPFPYEPFEEFHVADFRDRLAELLCEEDFDLVHFEWTQMALYSDLFESIPRVMTEIEVNYAAHETMVAVETRPFRKIRLYYNALQTLYREVEMCRRVDRVICVTDDDRKYLEGYVPAEKLAVINTGVDTRYFRFEPEGSDPDALVFVGAFRHYPNLDAMRFFCGRIFPRILAERPGTRLYVVGSSPPPEVEALGEHPGITVTGFVDDIREYYRRAQVVVVPLRTGVGIRGKILEGWAAGRATVATSLACQGIRAVHGENILVADDPEEFALWTLALLRNRDVCRTLGRNGRETVERYYEWDLLGDQMARFYEETVREYSTGGAAG